MQKLEEPLISPNLSRNIGEARKSCHYVDYFQPLNNGWSTIAGPCNQTAAFAEFYSLLYSD